MVVKYIIMDISRFIALVIISKFVIVKVVILRFNFHNFKVTFLVNIPFITSNFILIFMLVVI